MSNNYKNFSNLNKNEKLGDDYKIHFRDTGSQVLIMAPHGGRIEPGTYGLAREIAGSDFNYYGFLVRKAENNRYLHIPSINFDEPTALKLLKKAVLVIVLHGAEGDSEMIMMGGKNELFNKKAENRLLKNGFKLVRPLPGLEGMHKENICNKGITGKGTQIEITGGLRKAMLSDMKKRKLFICSIRESIWDFSKIACTQNKVIPPSLSACF